MLFGEDLGDDVCPWVGALGALDDLQLACVARIGLIVYCDRAERTRERVFRRQGEVMEARAPLHRANGITRRIRAGGEGLREKVLQGSVLDQKAGAQGDGVWGDGSEVRYFCLRWLIVADENRIYSKRR